MTPSAGVCSGSTLLEMPLKSTTVREGMRQQFRFEFLNALNHASFPTPGTDPYSASFGVITSQRGLARRVRLGLKLLY